ncbi:MAG: Spo0B domain-containing protein, partial [Bacillota bacterium]|nr:Spo0B domain-containing protein [Bacillota bacterium]
MRKKLYVSKTVVSLIIFNIIQASAAIGVLLYNYFHGSRRLEDNLNSEHLLLFLILLAIFINSYFTIKDVNSLAGNDEENHILKNSLHQVENLNNTLRAQRHDFMNHLQVVHGLLEMDEFDEAKGYIEKLFQDIQKVNNFLKTANPAVNALLQAKIVDAEKNNIEVVLNIRSRLQDIKIPSWELCRVLGNILDNAIYSLKAAGKPGIIKVELSEDLKNYGFRISNNGPEIEKEIVDRIFNAGFSTKGGDGQGMGLFICRDILSRYEGNIRASSTKESTEFSGWFAK